MVWTVQTRYILGDAGYSSVTGYGHDAPTHVQNEASSCPQPPVQCNAVSAELSPNPNPNTMYGALVEGPIYTDTFQVTLHPISTSFSTHMDGKSCCMCRATFAYTGLYCVCASLITKAAR